MNDDVSAIPTDSGCNVIISPNQIIHYANAQNREIYFLIGDTWVKTQTNHSNYNYNYSDYECVDVSQLSSQNIGFYPVYEFMTIATAGLVLFLVFWLVLKPLIWGMND